MIKRNSDSVSDNVSLLQSNGFWMKIDKRSEILIAFLFLLLLSIIAVFSKGTSDDGDSIMHYLFSRYALSHPENFLNHWAKPLFVLLTVLPAQLGFMGVKLFNVVCITGAGWFTYLTAHRFKLKHAWMAMPLFLLSTATYSFGLSGLTEPLFALWLIAGIWLLVSERYSAGVVFLSFLPFVRSEGLIILLSLAVYLLIKRKWKLLPLMAVGHIAYGLIGLGYYGDFFWIFNRNPYATLKGVYGSGEFLHYLYNMDHVITWSQYLLLITGLFAGVHLLVVWIRNGFNHKWDKFNELIIIQGFFFSYLLAHSLFWYLGIFNSFGLMRVLLGVLPLMVLIMIRGFDTLDNILLGFKSGRLWSAIWVIFFILISSILVLKEIKFRNSLGINDIQLAMKEVYENHSETIKDHTIISDSPYAAYLTNVNYYDPKQFRRIKSIYTGEPLPAKTVIFWDDWFAVFDSGADLEKLKSDKRFQLMGEASSQSVYPWAFRKSALFKLLPEYGENKVIKFEDFESWVDKSSLDSVHYYSGRYSQSIYSENAYSTGAEVFVTGLETYTNGFVVVEAWLKCPDGGCIGQAVFSFESQYKPYFYKSFELAEYLVKDEWIKVKFKQKIQKHLQLEDKLKVYFWNPGPQKLQIDEFKVYIE